MFRAETVHVRSCFALLLVLACVALNYASAQSNVMSNSITSVSEWVSSFPYQSARAEPSGTLEGWIEQGKKIENVKRLLELLLSSPKFKKDKYPVIWALGKLGDKGSIEFVAPFLRSEDVRLRLASVEAIGFLGRGDSSKLLLPSLSDEDENVRANACVGLARIGDRSVITQIQKLIEKETDLSTRRGDRHAFVAAACVSALRALED